MRQFPIIARIHENFIRRTPNTQAMIHVQRADPSLLYWKAYNIDGDGHHLIGDHDQIGTRFEWALIVGTKGNILREVTWSRRDRHFIKDALAQFLGTQSIQVAYVLVASRYNWYEKFGKEQPAFGNLRSKEVIYNVHLAPKEGGFAQLLKLACPYRNVELTEWLLSDGLICEDEDFNVAMERLNAAARSFEVQVYEHGLKDLIHKSKARGMSGQFGEVNLMSWVMCGRLMVTFEAPNRRNPKNNDTFTIIGNEPPEESGLGFRSICATADRALEMVDTVMNIWKSTAENERGKLFGDNKDVKLDAVAAMEAASAA